MIYVRSNASIHTRHHKQNLWSPLVKLEEPPIWKRQILHSSRLNGLTLTGYIKTYVLRARPNAPCGYTKTPLASPWQLLPTADTH